MTWARSASPRPLPAPILDPAPPPSRQRHVRGRVPTVAFSNTLGEGGTNATALAYLASAFDKAYVAPTGMVSLLGFDGTTVFYKRLLDKVGLGRAAAEVGSGPTT